MDPNNPIVKLCAAGMAAEGAGQREEALALFERAWETSSDDYEACIAAHYIARHQSTAEAELEWNEEALRCAESVADERVRGFYPSLYLNFAHSLEKVGRTAEAREYYERAATDLERLPDTPYARLVRMGVTAGRARVLEGT
jgi:tetratricopeptide (TPR) repeat protein